jgi:hypothetical protein
MQILNYLHGAYPCVPVCVHACWPEYSPLLQEKPKVLAALWLVKLTLTFLPVSNDVINLIRPPTVTIVSDNRNLHLTLSC